MRVVALLVTCVLLTFAGHKGAEAEYIGGTRADIPAESAGDIKSPTRSISFLSRSRPASRFLTSASI